MAVRSLKVTRQIVDHFDLPTMLNRLDGGHESWHQDSYSPQALVKSYGFSNCPNLGEQDSWHLEKSDYQRRYLQAMQSYLAVADDAVFDELDSCAFIRRMADDRWELVEISPIQKV